MVNIIRVNDLTVDFLFISLSDYAFILTRPKSHNNLQCEQFPTLPIQVVPLHCSLQVCLEYLHCTIPSSSFLLNIALGGGTKFGQPIATNNTQMLRDMQLNF